MSNARQEKCKKDINQRREELHKLIENEDLLSDVVQESSRELDDLILSYYRKPEEECQEEQPEESQELNEP